MYTIEDIKANIMTKGIPAVLQYLTSEKISSEEKKSLQKHGILSDTGYPCLSMLITLGLIA